MWKHISKVLSAIGKCKKIPEMPTEDEVYNKNISFMESISEAIPQLILSTIVLRSYGLSSQSRTNDSSCSCCSIWSFCKCDVWYYCLLLHQTIGEKHLQE